MTSAISLRATQTEPLGLSALETWTRADATFATTAFRPEIERTTDEEGRPLLLLAIHPAAEPVRVTEIDPRHLELAAETGTAGPGYHQHVCALIDRARSELGWTLSSVDDESGYFESRNRAVLENAAFIWLSTTALEILSLDARGHRGLQLSLPADIVFEHDGLLATPLGPRDHAWLRKVAREGRAGIDVLPWWSEGEGASTLAGAAESAMWIDVRWRAPLLATERARLERIVGWLEKGLALDPERSWRWAEWSEIYEHLGEQSLRATRAHMRASKHLGETTRIGYRRQPLRVTLSGGWSMRVPGTLAERWEDRGTWVGWDERRSIWFNSAELRGARGTSQTMRGLPELEGSGELLATERGEVQAEARWDEREEDGRRVHVLRAHAAFRQHAAIGTIVVEREEDRDSALEIWGSLAHLEENLAQSPS